MGNCVGGFKRRTTRIAPWKRNKTIVLCFLGIDGAGKTTIVKALQGEDFGTVHQTIGFSRAEINILKYKVYGIVYIVDSSATSRLTENKQIVEQLIEVSELIGKPILFLLNKKDLPEAIDEIQFSERFKLHNMAKRNKTDIRVEGVCAVKGTGKEIDQVIIEGLEWLIDKILDNYENISKGVEQAIKKLRERQAQERLERQHRLAISAISPEDSPETRSENIINNIENNEKEKENKENIDNEIISNKLVVVPFSNGNLIKNNEIMEDLQNSENRRSKSSLSNEMISERKNNNNDKINRPATSGEIKRNQPEPSVNFKIFEIQQKEKNEDDNRGMEMKEI